MKEVSLFLGAAVRLQLTQRRPFLQLMAHSHPAPKGTALMVSCLVGYLEFRAVQLWTALAAGQGIYLHVG